ncbi:hypothetical protein [Microbacterium gorillae]|uniref:hypothetical protein n=1 Tax=Microbacterium gorillae TaxID=1231063 RepID=UPI00058B4873|nr:hypothetical protein [Microbacterium gorillae]
MTSPAQSSLDRVRLRAASWTALVAGLLGGLLALGFNFGIGPLGLWTYPVAVVLAIVAIVAAIRARAHGLRIARSGGTFPGWVSLLGLTIGVITLLFTFVPALAFVVAQFR